MYHGGDIYKTEMLYGIKKEDIIDFSSNINPLGPSEMMIKTLKKSIKNVNRYPDQEYNLLNIELSKYSEVSLNQVIPGNGAEEIIDLFFKVLKPKKILIVQPTFLEYERCAKINNIETVFYELKEENEYSFRFNEFNENFDKNVDLVMICNPNNPTSKLIDSQEMTLLIQDLRKKNINLLIDESFIELTSNGVSMSSLLEEYDNIFIVKSLTKYFSIPGVRLAYGVANETIIKKMWANKLTWSINTFACEIGVVINKDLEFKKNTKKWIISEYEYFYKSLEKIKNLKVYKPDTNFILLKILDSRLNATILKDIMIRERILIRDASNFRYLNDKFFRIAIKDRRSNFLISEVLKEIVE